MARRPPGQVRDAIVGVLQNKKGGATVKEIHAAVEKKLGGDVAPSSVRSYLRLPSSSEFERLGPGRYKLRRRAAR